MASFAISETALDSAVNRILDVFDEKAVTVEQQRYLRNVLGEVAETGWIRSGSNVPALDGQNLGVK